MHTHRLLLLFSFLCFFRYLYRSDVLTKKKWIYFSYFSRSSYQLHIRVEADTYAFIWFIFLPILRLKETDFANLPTTAAIAYHAHTYINKKLNINVCGCGGCEWENKPSKCGEHFGFIWMKMIERMRSRIMRIDSLFSHFAIVLF